MLNFGIVYGMSDFGLAWRMGMARDEAARFIDEYFKRYALVRRYVMETKSFALEQGYVETLLGRRRYIPDMASSNGAVRGAAERMAINMPVQGTAADIMKIAMVKVHDRVVHLRLGTTDRAGAGAARGGPSRGPAHRRGPPPRQARRVRPRRW